MFRLFKPGLLDMAPTAERLEVAGIILVTAVSYRRYMVDLEATSSPTGPAAVTVPPEDLKP